MDIEEEINKIVNVPEIQTEQENTPRTRARTRNANNPRKSQVDSTEESDLESDEINEIKSANLFTENDVEGKLIYGFKTMKKRDGMVNKALYSTNSPAKDLKITKLNTTPLKQPQFKPSLDNRRTPHAVRHKIKRELTSLAHHSDNSDADFSDSGSEYNPDETKSSSSLEDDCEISEKSEDEESWGNEMEIVSKVKHLKIQPVRKIETSKRGKPKKEINYILQSDNYFSTHTSSKAVTSNHTLDKLKNPRLSQDKIQQILKSMKLPEAHEKSLKELFEEYKKQFPKWLFILREGFSILLHGLGSKRNILNAFHQNELSDQDVVVVNGFFPSLTIKDILDSIVNVLDLNSNLANVHEVVDLIEEELIKRYKRNLYLIVHNIDGPMLRNGKAQNVLARLAKIEKIHLLGSIDHINAPLMWDHTKLSFFNFCWFDVTSLLPYSYETSFEGSLLVHNSGALALSSLKNVFESLTSNSRGIYLIIVKNQLANNGNQNYQGMSFKDLYWSCREAFLVSSDLALRAQLTEFLDHKLVKMKRTMDGIEHLQIPIENSLLQQFTEQQSK